jgi:hypothetical protein
VRASRALYVKLGEGGNWAERCIERDNTVQLGFNDVGHSLCARGAWERVRARAAEVYGAKLATRVANQLREFYTAPEDVLWITFHRGALWWCFSRSEVRRLEGGYRERPVIGRWRNVDIRNDPLVLTRLSGKLTMKQGFRGTLCSVGEQFDYLVRKINTEEEPNVEATRLAYQQLSDRVQTIIENLNWRDFEILVDLVFRQAGWRRVSELGGPQKTLDLILDSPITGERFGVQVKSSADSAALAAYKETFEGIPGLARHYFVVHSPSGDLEDSETVEVVGPDKVADWSIRYGLVDWLVDRAG